MRHLGQVGDKDLVAHRAAQAHGQFGTALLECLGTQYLAHGNHLRVTVRHLDADSAFAGHGRDDADAQGGQTQSDVILQAAYLVHAHAVLRHDFEQGHRWAHVNHDLLDLDTIFAQRVADAFLVLVLFLLVHAVGVHADVLQQVQGGEAVVTVFACRVVRIGDVGAGGNGFQVGCFTLIAATSVIVGPGARLAHLGSQRVFRWLLLFLQTAGRNLLLSAQEGGFARLDDYLFGFFLAAAAFLADLPLKLLVQGIKGLVGEHYPQHENHQVNGNHAIHAHQSQQPFVGIEAEVASKRGEEMGLLTLAHESHA